MLQAKLPHMVWRLIKGQTLRYRCWDNEAVLYNDVSGATHLLGPAALCVLEALRSSPLSVTALVPRLLDQFDIDEELLGAELDSLLDQLSRLSLIESCPC